MNLGDTTKPRLFFIGGRISHYDTDASAYTIWRALAKGVRVAFRNAGDTREVFAWDFLDRPDR